MKIMLKHVNPSNWLYQVRFFTTSNRFWRCLVWFTQNVDSADLFLKCLKLRLIDNFIQEKGAIIEKSPKCHTNIYMFCLQYYLRISIRECYTALI